MRLWRFAVSCMLVTALAVAGCTKKAQPEQEKSPLTTQDIQRLEAALRGDETAQNAVFVPELRANTFSANTKVTLDESTRKTGQSIATIEAEVDGRGRWLLGLVREGDSWLVWHTQKAELQSTTPKALAAEQVQSRRVAQVTTISAQAEECSSGFGTRTPVLLVHGLMGNVGTWGRTSEENTVRGVLNGISSLTVDTFDYERWNLLWIDNSNIGPRLAQRISCLATSSRQEGGPGKVIVVAHSMGGLAARFAAAQVVDGRKVADDIGLVVTIGTPHLGSGLANWAITVVRDICAGFTMPGLLSPSGALCAMAVDYLTAIGGLKLDSQKLKALSAFPGTFPVRAIAGNVVSSVDVFGSPMVVANGDLVVAVQSATQGVALPQKGGGTSVLECKSLFLIPLVTQAECEHGRLLTNPAVHKIVVDSIQTYVASTAPKGVPFEFHSLKLWLPEQWKVEGPDYVNTDPACDDGICPGLSFKYGAERSAFLKDCQPAQKVKTIQAGGKEATWFMCHSAPLPHWDIPDTQITIAGYGVIELEEVLKNAQWN